MKYTKLTYWVLIVSLLFGSCAESEVEILRPEEPDAILARVKSILRLNGSLDQDYEKEYRASLYRSYGVGYGYNAFGSYADYQSVRDVLFNLDSLVYYEALEHCHIMIDDRAPEAYQKVMTGEDSQKLLSSLSANASLSADLSFFQAEAKGSYASSDLRSDSYSFCTIHTGMIMASRHIDPYSLAALCVKHPSILSPGIRIMIEEVEKSMTVGDGGTINLQLVNSLVDLIFEIYGGHFIYHADLGGRLSFLSTFERSSLDSKCTLSASAKANLLEICDFQTSQKDEVSLSQTATTCKSRITAKGGDARLISQILFTEDSVSNTEVLATNLISEWYQTIEMNFEDPSKSNTELIEMKLFPLDEFLTLLGYEELSHLVSQRIGKQMEYENGLFPRVYDKVNVRIPIEELFQASTTQIHHIVSSKEVIGEIDYEYIFGREFFTFYPTIEGKLCHEGIARAYGADSLYLITWHDTLPYITPLCTAGEAPFLYYTHGNVDLAPLEGEEYNAPYTNQVMENYMWTTVSNASLKVGPYVLIQGSYATLDTKTYSNYGTVSKDIPTGYQEVRYEDALPLLDFVKRHYSFCPDMMKGKQWLFRTEGAEYPSVYNINDQLSLNLVPDGAFGFILCRRSGLFRYP